MPKNKHAQALGKLGGKATAARDTTQRQKAARSLNAAKATAARIAKAAEHKESKAGGPGATE